MAAVALSKDELDKILPDGVYIGCQNSSSSTTITGPAKAIMDFIKYLQLNGVLVKIVNTSGLAFHSKYVEEAGKYLLEFLREVIETPKRRSSKWISSSVPKQDQLSEWTQYSCPEYHYSNFCNPVLFDQVLEQIPKNAIVVEIAPHGLLQSIIKKELSSEVTSISLTDKKSVDNEQFFLSSIGR